MDGMEVVETIEESIRPEKEMKVELRGCKDFLKNPLRYVKEMIRKA